MWFFFFFFFFLRDSSITWGAGHDLHEMVLRLVVLHFLDDVRQVAETIGLTNFNNRLTIYFQGSLLNICIPVKKV